MNNKNQFLSDEDTTEESVCYPIENFSLTTTPNDFNISTMISFLDAGVFKIPDFQRNYVWDIHKASRLIESLLIGLPIPQMFLYEQSRNEFLVIDGQQRLMSIYFFIKGRFPKNKSRILLKQNPGKGQFLDNSFLNDDDHFANFSLKLNLQSSPHKNRFDSLKYTTLLAEDKVTLDLATIRNMIIKPTLDNEFNSQSMFEIFNRLNSGGMNLNDQEIRMSLYDDSHYIRSLKKFNKNQSWRKLLGKQDSDLRLKDVESILRVYAMLFAGDKEKCDSRINFSYQNSIIGFLNNFANFSRKLSESEVDFLFEIWEKFMSECNKLKHPEIRFSGKKLSITFFESIFYAACKDAYSHKDTKLIHLSDEFIDILKNDQEFRNHSMGKTSSTSHVYQRLKIAYEKYQSLFS